MYLSASIFFITHHYKNGKCNKWIRGKKITAEVKNEQDTGKRVKETHVYTISHTHVNCSPLSISYIFQQEYFQVVESRKQQETSSLIHVLSDPIDNFITEPVSSED